MPGENLHCILADIGKPNLYTTTGKQHEEHKTNTSCCKQAGPELEAIKAITLVPLPMALVP